MKRKFFLQNLSAWSERSISRLAVLLLVVLQATLSAQSIPSYVPTSGLVGWWPFNGNANDESGNGNHGTVNGATLTADRHGNVGKAYSFNGINSFISGNCSSFPVNQRTISFWFLSPFQVDNTFFLGYGGGTCGTSFGLYANTNGCGDQGLNALGYSSHCCVHNFNTSFGQEIVNKWTNLVLETDNSGTKIYINGFLGNTVPIIVGNTNTATKNFIFGGQIDWDGLGLHGVESDFLGSLDDIAIWNRALTQTEIIKLYQAGLQYSISTQRDGNCAGGTVNLTATTSVSLSTTAAGSITNNSAISGGNITNDGGQTITQRGVCWSTSPAPTIALSTKTSDGAGSGSFSSSLSGLAASTTYYVRAYATTASGTWYGNERTFTTTAPALTVTDIDGNVYNTVSIGTQTWMKENLKVSKYRNGDAIPTGLTDAAWSGTTSGAFAIYNNEPVNNSVYGKLYNWYAVVDSRGLCPTGWHVPSDSEWFTLENFLDPTINSPLVVGWRGTDGGGKMKSTSGLWSSPNLGVSNSSGFSALPGGFRDIAMYNNLNITGVWWTSTVKLDNECWYRGLRFDYSQVDRKYYSKSGGFSIRCIKD